MLMDVNKLMHNIWIVYNEKVLKCLRMETSNNREYKVQQSVNILRYRERVK